MSDDTPTQPFDPNEVPGAQPSPNAHPDAEYPPTTRLPQPPAENKPEATAPTERLESFGGAGPAATPAVATAPTATGAPKGRPSKALPITLALIGVALIAAIAIVVSMLLTGEATPVQAPVVSPGASSSPSATTSPTPTPSATPTESPSATPTPSPSPSPTPSPTPTATPSPTDTGSPTPVPSPTPTPSVVP